MIAVEPATAPGDPAPEKGRKWNLTRSKMEPDEIRALRKELRLTQTQFAHWLKLSGNDPGETVRSWESGRRPPSGPVVVLLTAIEQGFVPDHVSDPQMKTIYGACLARLGLSHQDAAELHRVGIERVRSWAAGRHPVPPGVWAELRDRERKLQDAVASLRRQLAERGDDPLDAWDGGDSTTSNDTGDGGPASVMAFAVLLLEEKRQES